MIPMIRSAFVFAHSAFDSCDFGTWGSNNFFYDNPFQMNLVKSQIVRNFSGLNLCVRDGL